jgi:hypothetical protein
MQQPPRRGCRPTLIGCLGVTALIVLALGAAGWFLVARPVLEVMDAIERLEARGSLADALAQQAPFEPPADRRLTRDHVERYLAATEALAVTVELRVGDFQRLADDLEGRNFDGFEVITAAREWLTFLRAALGMVDAQVTALDAQGFSFEEYVWVRYEVLRASDAIDAPFDPQALAAGFGAGRAPLPPLPEGDVPPENVALIATYRERLDRIAFVAALGM